MVLDVQGHPGYGHNLRVMSPLLCDGRLSARMELHLGQQPSKAPLPLQRGCCHPVITGKAHRAKADASNSWALMVAFAVLRLGTRRVCVCYSSRLFMDPAIAGEAHQANADIWDQLAGGM